MSEKSRVRYGCQCLFLAILVLLFPPQLYATDVFSVSSREIVSLEGTWTVIKGDNPRYSDPAYDDSGWETIGVPGNAMSLFPGHTGVVWYRTRLFFPSDTRLQSMFIELGKISDVDECYFNGNLIGKTGSIEDKNSHFFDRLRLYQLPPELVKYGEENVLAVRVRGYLPDSLGLIWGTYNIGPSQDFIILLFKRYLVDVLAIGVYLFLAFYFFSFSWMKTTLFRHQRAFAVTTLTAAIYLFCVGQVKYLFWDNFYVFHVLQYVVGMIGVAALLIFMRRVMFKKITVPDRVVIVVLLLSAIAVIVIGEIKYFVIPRVLWQLCILYVVFVGAASSMEILRNRQREYIFIALAFSIIVAGLLFEVLRAYSVVPDFDYLKVGLLGFIVTVSFQLAEQFSVVHQIEQNLRIRLEDEVLESTRELKDRNDTIENQLEIARLLQSRLFPDSNPAVGGLDIHARCIPMDKVGGDFYDYWQNDAGMFTVIIADVSGHGVPGAFLALITRNAFRNAVHMKLDPKAILSLTNSAILESTVQSHFVTGCICSVDTRTGHMRFANAGHPPPVLLEKTTGEIVELWSSGKPLGWLADPGLDLGDITLGETNRVFLYTDGVIECRNPGGELFGYERIRDFLLSTKNKTPGECVDILMRELESFSGESSFEDDITVFIMDPLSSA